MIWTEEKCVKVSAGNMVRIVTDETDAAFIALSVCYILNISYPRCFGKILGFMQGILTDTFLDDQLCGNKLMDLKKAYLMVNK